MRFFLSPNGGSRGAPALPGLRTRNPMSLRYRYLSAVLLVMLLTHCGSDPAASRLPPVGSVDLAFSGRAVTKVRTVGDEIVLMEERLIPLLENDPQRSLSILLRDGNTRSYTPPSGWSLVDFAVHPSGGISAVLTTTTDVRILRLNTDGAVLSDQLFLDAESPADPFFNYDGGIKDDTALQPALMPDAARLAPLGESLALVLRTGRNAIVAYRLDP